MADSLAFLKALTGDKKAEKDFQGGSFTLDNLKSILGIDSGTTTKSKSRSAKAQASSPISTKEIAKFLESVSAPSGGGGGRARANRGETTSSGGGDAMAAIANLISPNAEASTGNSKGNSSEESPATVIERLMSIGTTEPGPNEKRVSLIAEKERTKQIKEALGSQGEDATRQQARQLDQQESKKGMDLISKLLVSIGAGLTTAGGGDASGILKLAQSRLESQDKDFNLKELAGKALIDPTGQEAQVLAQAGVSREEILSAAGASTSRDLKLTSSDVDLMAAAKLATEDPSFFGSVGRFFEGAEAKARREVLASPEVQARLTRQGKGGVAAKTKSSLRTFASESAIRKANPPSGRVSINGQEFDWVQE